ncbi:unnamed protein product [Notodromas monacha]|uniref:Trans-1,2-dihydrobenzene-1,2-diol dehydrogenase n=1 Tax=Notodromas monacha TaxID=399045 RepID=A0A7R9GA55_9CRUS|nr:unnamed protein product [Notodromas monacha]CAG0913758.1 unnamed protein product [Notodromas monacha]
MKIKWGIVSCGRIAKDFTAALQTLDKKEHEVVAVAARDLKKAEAFAQEFDVPKFYGSYEELAKDPDVEVTYVATINPSHVCVCKMMMDNGKSVLCEKPMGMNRKQCEELIAYAKKSNVFLMEAMWARFNPAYVELRKMICSEKIGKVKHANCTFGIPMQDVERLGMKKLGGGITLDIGIYCVHLASVAFWREKPEKIIASGYLTDEGVDWSASVIMEYSGGRSAAFTYSGLISMANEASVTATEGVIKLRTPFWCTDVLEDMESNEVIFKVPIVELPNTNFMNSYILRFEAEEVRKCIMKGKLQSSTMSWDDTLAVHEILDEIRHQLGVVYDEDISTMNPSRTRKSGSSDINQESKCSKAL